MPVRTEVPLQNRTFRPDAYLNNNPTLQGSV
jgi:hypothetical protein